MSKLYITLSEAAEYVGVGERYMRDLMHSDNPPPHLRVGKKQLLQKAALPAYFESLQEVRHERRAN